MVDDAEPLVDAAIAALRANLNGAITTINQAEQDFELDPVRDDAYRPGGIAGVSPFYPFVEVTASDVLLSQPTNQQVAWNRSETTVIFAIWAQHADDETLYRSTLRYARALKQVISTAGAFGDEAWVERVRVSYRRNPENRQTEQLTGFAIVAATVVTDEAL